MKRCPSCQRTYEDDSLAYCLEDGSALFGESSDLPATVIMPDPRTTNPAKPETFRPNPTPAYHAQPQAHKAPQPVWSPAATPQTMPQASPHRGRGLAVTSLICAIAAFLLLGFCIIGGAVRVDDSLIGGIFIFSALLGLLGAVLGIAGVVKTGKDTSPQNSRMMAIVAFVLNCIYLLVVVVFLILWATANSR